MKPRNILILIITAAVLAAAAVFTRKDESKQKTSAQLGDDLFPSLDVNAVRKIEMTAPDSTVTVARVDGAWVVTEKFGYPASFGRVKEFLLGLTELKQGMEVPANDDDRASLQLLDPSLASAIDKGSAATRLTLYNESGSALTSILVGKQPEAKAPQGPGPMGFGGYASGRYIDLAGTVYLLSENLSDVGQTTDRWLEKQLLNIPRSEIVEVTRSGPDVDAITISRAGVDDSFSLADLATNEVTVSYKMDNLTGALSFLNFSDIASPSLSVEETGLAAPVLFTARTAIGKIITVMIGGKVDDGETRYASIWAIYEAPPLPAATSPLDAEAEAARLEQQAKAQQEVSDLNAGVANWVYILESYISDRFLIKRVDLLEPPPEPEEEDQPDADADGADADAPAQSEVPESDEDDS
ncbi:MAG: DUF4340 domain-containing protein [Verrucomicrobia bacterium]|nr:DUF4340 domain-containing protein [Verrucomicrobiota bacterium]MDA1085627.1 DUF4340 domain-containing protein [Verrucomicrobiota bacterium]